MGNEYGELTPLVGMILASAIDTVTEVGIPFPAFVVVEKDGNRRLHRFVTARLEEALMQAHMVAQSNPEADFVAIAEDSIVHYENKRWDAISISAWNERTQTGLRIIQRYKKRGLIRKTGVMVGEPTIVG